MIERIPDPSGRGTIERGSLHSTSSAAVIDTFEACQAEAPTHAA